MNALNKTARIAGVLYLIIFVTGFFADGYVRGTLILPDDPATTAQNIATSEGLFRIGIASDIVMIMADVALGVSLYFLLRSVSRPLAMAAAFFRLAQAATLGINLLNLFYALQLLSGIGFLGVFSPDQVQAQALVFLNAHATGYQIGLIFFAFSLLVLGYLLYRSNGFPKFLGILQVVAAIGYLIDGAARIVLVNYAAVAATTDMIVIVAAVIGELALCLWLLIKGVKVHAVREGAALAPA